MQNVYQIKDRINLYVIDMEEKELKKNKRA